MGATHPPLLNAQRPTSFAFERVLLCSDVRRATISSALDSGLVYFQSPTDSTGTTLIVSNDVQAMSHEVSDDEAHVASLVVGAVNEDDRRPLFKG